MIHETAVISEDARIGDNVAIGPYSVIEAGVTVGDNCRIGPHVSLYQYTSLGDGCEVHAGAAVGGKPQDKGFEEAESFVEVGAGCVIREGVTIHRGTGEGTVTKIGNDCFLMALAHVAHNCILGNGVIMANGSMLGGHVEVGDGAFISGGAGIHQFVRIGRLALIGGNSVCGKDVPPFCMVEPCTWGSVEGLNVVGMRRAGVGPEDRLAVKRIFKMLYVSGMNVKQAVTQIDEMGGEMAVEMSEFIRGSQRGICGSSLSIG